MYSFLLYVAIFVFGSSTYELISITIPFEDEVFVLSKEGVLRVSVDPDAIHVIDPLARGAIDDISLSSLKYQGAIDHDSISPDDIDKMDQLCHSEPVNVVTLMLFVGVKHSPSCSIITFALSATQAFLYVSPFTPQTSQSLSLHTIPSFVTPSLDSSEGTSE